MRTVCAYAALLILALVGGCKLYVYLMVSLLKKLPDEPSSDPLNLVIKKPILEIHILFYHKVYALDLTIPAENVVKISNYATDIVNSGLSELKKL